MCSYNWRPMRQAPALHTACETADADSQPGTSTSAGSSGITTTAAALPLPLCHRDAILSLTKH